jgi:hypothetical protein
VRELFEMVEKEKHHEGMPFWRIFLQNVRHEYRGANPLHASGASEYEIYYNFIMKHHRNDVEGRQLEWSNVSVNPIDVDNKNTYVSWHYYMR